MSDRELQALRKNSENTCCAGKSVSCSKSKLTQGLFPIALALLASLLVLVSLKLPLWKMHLEAPQYRDEEALNIAVYAGSFHGDLRELKVLNQYIGVHVPPTLPQFKWLPTVLVAGASLGLLGGMIRGPSRAWVLTIVAGFIAIALLGAAVQAKFQIHDIGHKRDQKTVLAGVQDFTPPFFGTAKIAQFTVTSRFGLGAWLAGGAMVLQLTAAWLSRGSKTVHTRNSQTLRVPDVSSFAATATRIL